METQRIYEGKITEINSNNGETETMDTYDIPIKLIISENTIDLIYDFFEQKFEMENGNYQFLSQEEIVTLSIDRLSKTFVVIEKSILGNKVLSTTTKKGVHY